MQFPLWLKFDKEEKGDSKTLARMTKDRYLMATEYRDSISLWIMDAEGNELEVVGNIER